MTALHADTAEEERPDISISFGDAPRKDKASSFRFVARRI